MDEEGAKKLVRDAITAGIINDMGSGSNVDIAVIKPGDDITYFRYVGLTVEDTLTPEIVLYSVHCRNFVKRSLKLGFIIEVLARLV